jgi:hypothetical protein
MSWRNFVADVMAACLLPAVCGFKPEKILPLITNNLHNKSFAAQVA